MANCVGLADFGLVSRLMSIPAAFTFACSLDSCVSFALGFAFALGVAFFAAVFFAVALATVVFGFAFVVAVFLVAILFSFRLTTGFHRKPYRGLTSFMVSDN